MGSQSSAAKRPSPSSRRSFSVLCLDCFPRTWRKVHAVLVLCCGCAFVQEPAAEDLYLMLGYNLSVPPAVRKALLSRSFDNDDLLPPLQKPVLIVHGERDPVVKSSVVDQHKASLPHAEVAMIPNAAHAPFWDDAPGFNARLRTF